MATKSALEALIDIAKKNSDALAKRLGESVEETRRSQEKMNTLLQFRQDYSERLTAAMHNGITPDIHRNYLVFIAKLDSAVESQKRDVSAREQLSKNIKAEWRESEKKRLSFTTLELRQLSSEQKKETKREQKSSDEQAARITLNKKATW